MVDLRLGSVEDLADCDDPFGKMLVLDAMFWHDPVETAIVCALGR